MEASLRVDTNRTQTRLTHAQKQMAPKAKIRDVMMSDKTVEIKSPMCAFAVLGSVGFTQPPQEGQETIISCSLQLK